VFLPLQTNPYYVKPRVADHQFGIKHYAGEVITSTHSVILVLLPVLFVSLERFYKVCRKLKCIKLTSDFICCYMLLRFETNSRWNDHFC